MGKDHAIDYEEEKRLLGLFGAAVVTTAQRMVEQNKHRYDELFFDYDPLTGEGAPGRRREIVIDDLYMGEEARLWLPIDMYSVGMIYWLEKLGSREELCYYLYGGYDEELRDAVVTSFLRTWAKYDFYFFAYAYARIKNKEGGDDIPFKLRPPQIKLTTRFETQRLAGKPIRVILLKARQWGGSTCTQIYMAWICISVFKG